MKKKGYKISHDIIMVQIPSIQTITNLQQAQSVPQFTCQKNRTRVVIVVEGEVFSNEFIEQQVLSTQLWFITTLQDGER